MILSLNIKNFKSLVDFSLPENDQDLGPFTCLIGLNGSGKSTLLQAFDFIAHVVTGNVGEWLEDREWKDKDILSNISGHGPKVDFNIRLKTDHGIVKWCARFHYTSLKCDYEIIQLEKDSHHTKLLEVAAAKKYFARSLDILSESSDFQKINFEYKGSILSALKLDELHPALAEVRSLLTSLCSLELLSPHAMRRRAKKAADIGIGGEKLSAFLSTFNPSQKENLLKKLKEFYPTISNWQTQTLPAGWKNLQIQESYIHNPPYVSATHMNDGLLRIIAILSQAYSSHKFLLFDEIENGINPSLVEKLVDFLVELGHQGKQVFVTTHSPLILNYLKDDTARKSVVLLFKSGDGYSRARWYFEQPETKNKLGPLGPGEVFADTDLNKMIERLSQPKELLQHKNSLTLPL